MGGKLSGHQTALNGKGQRFPTKLGIYPKELPNVAKELIGGEVHVFGTEQYRVKNKAFEGKGCTGNDDHRKGGAHQMPT